MAVGGEAAVGWWVVVGREAVVMRNNYFEVPLGAESGLGCRPVPVTSQLMSFADRDATLISCGPSSDGF